MKVLEFDISPQTGSQEAITKGQVPFLIYPDFFKSGILLN